MSTHANREPFSVKDCALVTIATGKKAQNLKEMREHLLNIHLGSIYHHFWGGLLRPRFDDPEYNNDFAEWVRHALQDNIHAHYGVYSPVRGQPADSTSETIWELYRTMLLSSLNLIVSTASSTSMR